MQIAARSRSSIEAFETANVDFYILVWKVTAIGQYRIYRKFDRDSLIGEHEAEFEHYSMSGRTKGRYEYKSRRNNASEICARTRFSLILSF
jgi:hypothetical protein